MDETITFTMQQWSAFQEQLIRFKSESFEFSEEMQKRSRELNMIKERLSNREEELKVLKEMVANSAKDQEELASLKRENQGLVRSLTQVNHQNQGQLEDLQRTVSTASKETEELRARVKVERQGRIETKRANIELQNELKSCQDQQQQQAQQIQQLQQQLQQQQAKVTQMTNSMKEKDQKVKTLEKEKGEAKQALEAAVSEKEELMKKLETRMEERGEQSLTGSTDSEMAAKVAALEGEKMEWEGKLSGALNERSALEAKLSALENQQQQQLQTLQANQEKLESAAVMEETEKEQLLERYKKQSADLAVNLKQLQAKVLAQAEEGKEKMGLLQKECDGLKEINKAASLKIKKLEVEVAKLTTTLKEQQEEGDKVIAKFSEIMLSNDKSKDDIRQLETKLAEADEKLRKQQESFGVLVQQRQKQVIADSERQMERISALERENSVLLENYNKLKLDCKGKDEINQLQVTQIEALKVSLQQLTTEFNESKVVSTQRVTNLTNDMELLSSHHQLLSEKFGKLQEKFEEAQNQLSKKTEEISVLNLHVQSLNEQIEKQNEVVEKLNSNIKQKEELNNNLTETVQLLTTEKSELILRLEEIPKCKEKIQSLENHLLESLESLDKLKKENQENQMAFKVEQKQDKQLIRHLQNQVRVLQGNGGDVTPVLSPSIPSSSSNPMLLSSPVNVAGLTPPGTPSRAKGLERQPSKSAKTRIVNTGTPLGSSGVGGSEENHVFADDLLVMGLRLGALQQTNFELEQENQNLKSLVQRFRAESEKKSKVIAKQIRGVKNNDNDFWNPHPKSNNDPLAFVGSLFNNDGPSPLQQEKDEKMSTVLEETLLQNIQLQDDIRQLATDVEKLSKEREALRKAVLTLTEQLETSKNK